MELEQIGKYRILKSIGKGAMGEVFQAHDPVLKRYVAIKIMAASIELDEDLRKRFEREAQSAARLNHPNIITVYDFGEEQGRIYMAMELLEGTDLKDAIRSRSLATLEAKIDVMEQICEGLAFAHARDVVHRDLKPANIRIQPDGRVKIVDFGLARLPTSDLTAKGMVMGTPHYMSPEQVRGEKADARSDIFSIGAVFYELLTNHKPFDAESTHTILYLVLQSDPEPIRKWAPEIPQGLVDLVERALAKDATLRHSNGGELREGLRAARRGLETGISVARTVAHLAPASVSVRPGSVAGSSALAVAAATPRPAPTLLGQAPTQVAEGTQPGARGPSRLPLLLGGAALLVAVGVGTALLLRPRPAAPPTDHVGLLTRQLAERETRLARMELEGRDLAAALTHAQEALKLEPASAEAKEVLRRVELMRAEIERTAAEARQAFEVGQTERASQFLAKLLSLDPRHPVAAELSQKMNSRFRGQAEETRRVQRRAQSEAERANARSQDGFGEAVSLTRDAEALFGRGEFAVAAGKFREAGMGFDRARRAAEVRAAEARAARATPVPAPTMVATLAPTPAPTLVAVPPPTPSPPTAPPVVLPTAAAVAPAPPPNEEPAIRRVVSDYGRAIESKDLELFRSVKPNLSADEERRLREAFRANQLQRVVLTVTAIEIAGNRATVRVNRRDKVDDHEVTSQQTLVLVKAGGAWTIRDITAAR